MDLKAIEKLIDKHPPPYSQADTSVALRTLKKLLHPSSHVTDSTRARAKFAYEKIRGVSVGRIKLASNAEGPELDRIMASHRGMVQAAMNRIVERCAASPSGIVKVTDDHPSVYEAAERLVDMGTVFGLRSGEEFVSRSKIDAVTGLRRKRRFITVCVPRDVEEDVVI
jgi:hypothetical protein